MKTDVIKEWEHHCIYLESTIKNIREDSGTKYET